MLKNLYLECEDKDVDITPSRPEKFYIKNKDVLFSPL